MFAGPNGSGKSTIKDIISAHLLGVEPISILLPPLTQKSIFPVLPTVSKRVDILSLKRKLYNAIIDP